jgi:glycine/D-amino acid oxidase-like deaminating enzyme
MATTSEKNPVLQIGDTAGTVWRLLTENGPMTMAKLVKAAGEPRDLVMQALGWLAREDKLAIEEEGRTRVISLKA